MNRKEFIKMCTLLGIGIPLQASLVSCKKIEQSAFAGKVIIIGAGAGGLSAAYLLAQKGIDFEILEASSTYGGRLKDNTDFAEFPIPLGAEWLETKANIFDEIVNDKTIKPKVKTFEDDIARKFENGSWFRFYEDYIVPSVSDKINYNSIVKSINYAEDKIVVSTTNKEYIADKIIISVPLKILQDNDIIFTPSLPQEKITAINEVDIWSGFKAFFEFSTNFYNEGHEFEILPKSDGEKLYYNASFGQNTNKNILGFFVVGKPALDYVSLAENDIKNVILNELDTLFANQATPNYLKHISQNWDNEPFIKAAYMSDTTDFETVKKLGKSVNDKIYFAGAAYTDGEDWVSVHNAAQSAKTAVKAINK